MRNRIVQVSALCFLACFLFISCDFLPEETDNSPKTYSIGEKISKEGVDSTVERVFYWRTSFGDKASDASTGENIIVAKIKFTNGSSRSVIIRSSLFALINGTTQCDSASYGGTPYDPEGNSFTQNESKTIMSGVSHTLYVVFKSKTGLVDNTFKIVYDDDVFLYPFTVVFTSEEIE
jgi:hypothetical protein